MDKLKYANLMIFEGIAVIPLRHRGKEPEPSMLPKAPNPETGILEPVWEPYKTILSTSEEVHRWLYSGWQNYGVVCGWRDLVVIDFDDMMAFSVWWEWFALLNKHGEVYPMPYIVKSSRGAHVYISCPTLQANEKRQGVDVKCHGYVVGAGSVHPSGAVYEPITPWTLIDVFSLETILPVDLFPKIAENRSCGQIEALQVDLSSANCIAKPESYDPYQVAMFGGGEDLITIVKQRVRIESMLPGVKKSSADGRWLMTLCPFHNDHNPSMWIDTRRQLCGCNTCGMKPMDAINLYSRIHGMNESDAVSAMAKECGVWG